MGMLRYGVDVYSAGHIHDYEVILPVKNNTKVQDSLVEPKAPVHLISGNGGPPSASKFGIIKEWSLFRSTEFSYSRVKASNSTHLEWDQISNYDGRVIDHRTIVQHNHGPFPL